ncbi:MAG: TetR/AcrR family transcriptional regulator [Clostridiales bacterium]|nr:TetR/AcrR family transcriptional regulator [Clostridiales bacterium]
MEKKLDLRVQKTYKALLKALYDLLCEKSFDDITVTELCDRAETRKATFYKHFGDKRELFTFMVKEMQRTAREGNEISYDEEKPWSYYAGVFRYFLNFLDQNEQFVSKILDSSALHTLLDLMSEQIEADLRSHMNEDQARGVSLQTEANMLAVTYTGAIVYCGRWWISHNKPLDKEAVITQFSRLLMRL